MLPPVLRLAQRGVHHALDDVLLGRGGLQVAHQLVRLVHQLVAQVVDDLEWREEENMIDENTAFKNNKMSGTQSSKHLDQRQTRLMFWKLKNRTKSLYSPSSVLPPGWCPPGWAAPAAPARR